MADPKRQVGVSHGLPNLGALFAPPTRGSHRYFEGHELYPFALNTNMHSQVNAWWLAECALLAYEEADVVSKELSAVSDFIPGSFRWFASEGNRLQENTQGFLVESEHFAVIAFRGTECPAPSRLLRHPKEILDIFADLKTDLTLRPRAVMDGFPPFSCPVHPGVANALQTVWPQLEVALNQIIGKPLWLTGHSLGGALATLLAYQIPDQVTGLYNYGALPVGTECFAKSFLKEGLASKTFRYVHGKDPAPELLALARAGYQHVGAFVHLESESHRGTFGDWLRKAATVTTGLDPLDHAPILYAYETWNVIS